MKNRFDTGQKTFGESIFVQLTTC